jgi:hypothetical protein
VRASIRASPEGPVGFAARFAIFSMKARFQPTKEGELQ